MNTGLVNAHEQLTPHCGHGWYSLLPGFCAHHRSTAAPKSHGVWSRPRLALRAPYRSGRPCRGL